MSKSVLNRFILVLSVGLIGFFAININNNVYAFNEKSHRHITRSAYEAYVGLDEQALSDEKLKKVSDFFKKNESSYKQLLEDYSVQPDKDENQGSYKFHFYNPITETNYMNEKESSLVRFKSHFRNAVDNYSDGDKKEAYCELGRCIHFLEDINAPVHTAYQHPRDSIIKLPIHVSFEKKCDEICDQCKFKVLSGDLTYYDLNTLDIIARSAAILSSDSFYYLDGNNYNKEKIDEVEISKNSIFNAQKKVSGVLYKFFEEVNEY